MKTFVASDLSRDRKQVLASARQEGGALIRDTDGTVLAMVDASRMAAMRRLNEIATSFASLAASLDRPSASASSLGLFSWAAHWNPRRRTQLVRDVADALALSVSLNNAEPIEALLRQATEARAPKERFDGSAMWKALDEADRERLRTGQGLSRRTRASA